jgi:nucleotide-binding universal stress UspA family protein
VVGIDGSDDSLCAAGWAAEQAGARNLPLRIVVAADSVPAEGPDMAVGSADQLLDRAVERVRECVPDVTVSTQVIPGYARSVLREESRYASMLVVGQRGSGGSPRYGSVRWRWTSVHRRGARRRASRRCSTPVRATWWLVWIGQPPRSRRSSSDSR